MFTIIERWLKQRRAERNLIEALEEAQQFIADHKAKETPDETERWDERAKSMPAWRIWADVHGVESADKAFAIDERMRESREPSP